MLFSLFHRRMMMTSGEKVKYSSSMDCLVKITKAEGVASLFKGICVLNIGAEERLLAKDTRM